MAFHIYEWVGFYGEGRLTKDTLTPEESSVNIVNNPLKERIKEQSFERKALGGVLETVINPSEQTIERIH